MNAEWALDAVNPHWAVVAGQEETELKEAIITGYRLGKPFTPHYYNLFAPGVKANRVLDFGCGVGRNFQQLRRHAIEVVAFDIPGMIEACRKYTDCTGIELCADWHTVGQRRYDVCIATLVFQHIEDQDVLGFYLDEIARLCDFVYVSSRCWMDGPGHPNILESIRRHGGFEFIKGSLSESEILDQRFPAETHVDFLLRSKVQAERSEQNARLFDIDEMHYPVVADRIPVTMTQLFTPNYDHWAYKVLENKRDYCDRHGYRFHYRRGIFEQSADRHPSWHRIPLILELFEDESSEWVFWSDIDSVILRQDVRLEAIMAGHTDRDLIIPNQGAGWFLDNMIDDCLCFGQFFLRNREWSKTFLHEVWQFPFKYGYEKYLTEASWEQEAVNFIARNNLLDFTDHAAVLPNRVFNSFFHTQYRDGDFLVHFAGEAARGEGRREALVNDYLRKVRV